MRHIKVLNKEDAEQQKVMDLGKKMGQGGMRPVVESVEKLKSVPFNPLRLEWTIKIGSQLSKEEKEKLINFLKECIDVFAWTHEDMSGHDLGNLALVDD